MSLVEGIEYIVRWVTYPGACVKCLALNGQVWTIKTLEEATFLKDTFSHLNCKCELDVEITVNLEELQIG